MKQTKIKAATMKMGENPFANNGSMLVWFIFVKPNPMYKSRIAINTIVIIVCNFIASFVPFKLYATNNITTKAPNKSGNEIGSM